MSIEYAVFFSFFQVKTIFDFFFSESYATANEQTLRRGLLINYQRWSRGHKAQGKDTKKIRGQGQGQPFRRQTLSRPRTGMLEAKAKDQGHKRQVLSKKKKQKKVLTKIFQQAISKKKKKKKGLHKNFSSDLHKKTFSKKFFNRSAKF